MTQVNVDSMINTYNKHDYVEKQNEKQMLRESVKPKKKFTLKMGKPTVSASHLFSQFQSPAPAPLPPPISFNQMSDIKKGVFNAASYTMKDTDKRQIFKKKLEDNEYLNNYVEKKIGNSHFLARLSDDVKACAIYACTYVDAYNTPTNNVIVPENKTNTLNKVLKGAATEAEIRSAYSGKDLESALELNKIIAVTPIK